MDMVTVEGNTDAAMALKSTIDTAFPTAAAASTKLGVTVINNINVEVAHAPPAAPPAVPPPTSPSPSPPKSPNAEAEFPTAAVAVGAVLGLFFAIRSRSCRVDDAE